MSDEESLQLFPCLYTFKIFGRQSDDFVDHVRHILGATLGAAAEDSVTVRHSAAGRYLSVSIDSRIESREQLERVYADLHADAAVLLCI